MLVQLLLCIGLPFLILPILATIAYCGFRWLKAKKKKEKPVVKDVENGDYVLSSTKEESDEESLGPEREMTPALITNSVQVPVAFSRNF